MVRPSVSFLQLSESGCSCIGTYCTMASNKLVEVGTCATENHECIQYGGGRRIQRWGFCGSITWLRPIWTRLWKGGREIYKTMADCLCTAITDNRILYHDILPIHVNQHINILRAIGSPYDLRIAGKALQAY